MSKSAGVSFIYNVLGVVLARKNANALLAKCPVSKFGKSDVMFLGRDGENNNLDRESNNRVSSCVSTCLQDPPVSRQGRGASVAMSAKAGSHIVVDSVLNNRSNFNLVPFAYSGSIAVNSVPSFLNSVPVVPDSIEFDC